MSIQEQTDRTAAQFALDNSNGKFTIERQNGKLVLVNVQTKEVIKLTKKASFSSVLRAIASAK